MTDGDIASDGTYAIASYQPTTSAITAATATTIMVLGTMFNTDGTVDYLQVLYIQAMAIKIIGAALLDGSIRYVFCNKCKYSNPAGNPLLINFQKLLYKCELHSIIKLVSLTDQLLLILVIETMMETLQTKMAIFQLVQLVSLI